jgi:hypothetical protein
MRKPVWGQAFGPAAGLPPGAGERETFGQPCEPRLDGVPFDIAPDSCGFLVIADQVVVTFVLPEGAFVQSEQADRFVSREAFQRTEPFSGRYARGDKEMHVVRHDYEGVQFVTAESVLAIVEGTNDHFGYFRPTKKHRAAFGVIEQAIHCDERLSSREGCGTEDAAIRKTSVQTEGHKYSFAQEVQVRKAAFVPTHVGCSGGRG